MKKFLILVFAFIFALGLSLSMFAQDATPAAASPVTQWAPAITEGLGLLAIIFGFFGIGQRKKKKSAEAQLKAVVQGVERVAKALPENHGVKVKAHIADAATVLGVGQELYKTVKRITSPTRTGQILLLAFVCVFAQACAVARTDQQGMADGSNRTRTLVFSIWDARGVLNNFRASQSNKTQLTTLGTAGAESTATNLVTIAGSAVDLAKLLKP